MKITKIKIKNLFGIAEQELNGSSVEITGTNGTGKTSVIDAIRFALENDSDRDYIIKKGASEGEIIIEAGSDLYINRKKRDQQSDYKSVKEHGKEVPGAEGFLRKLFTPLQLDPVAFTQMSKKEQNRVVLDLIEFSWDLKWIREKFGEIPEGIDYQQNILQVLHDIQSENGIYFQRRQDVNRDARNKRAFIADISKDIPAEYQAEKWDSYDLGSTYRKLETIKETNNQVNRAKLFLDGYQAKVRGLEAERDIAIAAEEKANAKEKEFITSNIERLKAELKAEQDKLGTLGSKLNDKKALAESQYNEKLAKLNADTAVARQYSGKEVQDCTALEEEVQLAEKMKKHLNEYKRMKTMQVELASLESTSTELTEKIELARDLPGEILMTAKIPIDGFSVVDGVPLINGLPISNLSEGEKLSLCVDVALSKPNALQIILIDGAEKLSDENRNSLYRRCKDHGLQFIATRTTNDNELEVHYL